MKGTVTLSVEDYEDLKEEIESLKKQVQEKTIYQDVIPPVYGWLGIILALISYTITIELI